MVQMDGSTGASIVTEFSFTASGPEDMIFEIPAGDHWGSSGHDGLLANTDLLSEAAVISISPLEVKRCTDENDAFAQSEHFSARWTAAVYTRAVLQCPMLIG